MSQTVTIIYLTGAGLYRRAKGIVSPEWATLVQNHRDHQAHSLVRDPVFPDMTPVRFPTWDEFVSAPPPQVLRNGHANLMVAEDDSFNPLAPGEPLGTESEEMAANARRATFQEAVQRARETASARDAGVLSSVVILLAAISGFMAVVLGTMVLLWVLA